MKKSDLKQLIKPLVKECIHEVLIEEGLLSNIVSEVTKGLQQNVIVETKQKPKETLFNEDLRMKRKSNESRTKLQEHRKKLLDAVGQDSYNGVDLFEGTDALTSGGDSSNTPRQPSVLGDNPRDAGVDISSIIGDASQVWRALK